MIVCICVSSTCLSHVYCCRTPIYLLMCICVHIAVRLCCVCVIHLSHTHADVIVGLLINSSLYLCVSLVFCFISSWNPFTNIRSLRYPSYSYLTTLMMLLISTLHEPTYHKIIVNRLRTLRFLPNSCVIALFAALSFGLCVFFVFL